jgi:ABC-type transport system involved in multi-copper enzyme maturation permease subunit
MNLVWQTICVHVRLNVAHPLGYVAMGLVVLWAASVPSMGVNRADFAARASELGHPPLSDSELVGLGAAQVASGFMTLFGVLLFLNKLDRERGIDLDELLASLPISRWSLIALQYLSNAVTLLFFALLAYVAALVAYPFRGFEAFSLLEFLLPGILFPLGSAFLLASLPLLLDALGAHQVTRAIAYGVIVILCNLLPFALAAISHLDHPLHPWFQVWFTANLGLDTFGVWYLQGYLNLVLRVIEQLGTSSIPTRLYWITVVRPRLLPIALGILLTAFVAWRFDRFEIAPER